MPGTSPERGTTRPVEDPYKDIEGNTLWEKRKKVIEAKNIVDGCIITTRDNETHQVKLVAANKRIRVRTAGFGYKTIEPIDVIAVEPPRKEMRD